MATNLKTVEGRSRLKPRREPYWEALRKGCFLGYRKMVAGTHGNWVARWRDPDTNKQHYSALGALEQLPPNERRDAAAKLAEAWFAHLGAGGRTDVVTVKAACNDYVDSVRGDRGNAPADDLASRFRRWVDDDKLAPIELTKLQPQHLLAWRKRLTSAPVKVGDEETRVRSRSAVNRDLTALRAALNHARRVGLVTTDAAWKEALKPFKDADGRRDVYLDRKQRRTLISIAAPDVGLLLRALSLVPLRPGALAGLSAGDFDKRLGALRIGKDKAGKDRKIALPKATTAFFLEQSKNKLPSAPLLCRADGMRWNKDAWKGPIKEAVLAAKLPTASTAYALRHSVITDLVHNGLDTLTVAQLSGTSVAMIEKHYGHLKDEHARAALASLVL
jgi:integrase